MAYTWEVPSSEKACFPRARDASKVALVHLVEHLKQAGFTLLDTQFNTAHLSQFGAAEIPKKLYEEKLEQALLVQAEF